MPRRLQAKLVSMKHDLAETKKEVAVLEKDNEVRLSQLHEATSGNMLRFVSASIVKSSKFESDFKSVLFHLTLCLFGLTCDTDHSDKFVRILHSSLQYTLHQQ